MGTKKKPTKSAAPAEPPKPRIKMKMVYIGRVKNDKEDRAWMYHEVTDEMNNGDKLKMVWEQSHTYTKKNIATGITPGTVIEIDATEDKRSVFMNTYKIVGRWKNDDDLKQWTIDHRAYELEVETATRALREIKERLPFGDLEDFRLAYERAGNSRRRSHILAMVIAAITGVKPLRSDKDDDY